MFRCSVYYYFLIFLSLYIYHPVMADDFFTMNSCEVRVGTAFTQLKIDESSPMASVSCLVPLSLYSRHFIGFSASPMAFSKAYRLPENLAMSGKNYLYAGYTVDIYRLVYEFLWRQLQSSYIFFGISSAAQYYSLLLDSSYSANLHILPTVRVRILKTMPYSSWNIEASTDISYMFGWLSETKTRIFYTFSDHAFLGLEYRMLYATNKAQDMISVNPPVGVSMANKFLQNEMHYGLQMLLGYTF